MFKKLRGYGSINGGLWRSLNVLINGLVGLLNFNVESCTTKEGCVI